MTTPTAWCSPVASSLDGVDEMMTCGSPATWYWFPAGSPPAPAHAPARIGWTDDPAILEIRDIPASSLSKAHGKYEIVDDAGLDAGLLEERERLQARIREIDALLASHAVA